MAPDNTRYHYGPSGEYKGFSSNTPPQGGAGCAGLLLLPVIIGVSTYKWISQYSEHGFPGNVVGFFYYWTVVFPLSLPFWAYGAVTSPGLTPFDNLNFILGIALFLIVSFFIISIFVALFQSSYESDAHVALIIIFLMPGTLYIGWCILYGAVTWLFAFNYIG